MAGEDEEQGEVDELYEIQLALHDVISDVLARYGLMPTKWLAAIELLDREGTRALETFCSPDFRAWDSIGMLGFLDARERGSVAADQQAEERPDSG